MNDIDEYGNVSMLLYAFGVHTLVRSISAVVLGPNPLDRNYEFAILILWAIFAFLTWGPDWLRNKKGEDPLYKPRQFFILVAVAAGFLTSMLFLIITLLEIQGVYTPLVTGAIGLTLMYFTANRATLMYE